MIAGLAQRPCAVAALRHRRTLRVVVTGHRFVMSSRLSYVERPVNVQRFFESSLLCELPCERGAALF
jgi:hypothetical protein